MERRLAAILAADVVGYSKLMSADEEATLTQLQAHRAELFDPTIAKHNGRIIKLMGDGTLVEFASVVDAVSCAIAIQTALAEAGGEIRLRIGVNLGDVIVDGDDIYGDGVNIAARLEALAETGDILVSRTVADHVKGKVTSGFEGLGERKLKGILEPVQVFRVVPPHDAPVLTAGTSRKPRPGKFTVMVAGVVALVLVIGGLVWKRPWEPREEPASVEAMAFPLPDRPSIAVLPFTNMSEDQSQAYFADGMTEDLITDLSKISGLFVIARNSSFSYKGQKVKVRKAAEELGVRFVLEGSVRRAGDQVRINAQLIDATTGGHIWAERYDGTLEGVFKLQDRVTEQIVAALSVNLTGGDRTPDKNRDTQNIAAHDAFLRGWSYYKLGTPAELTRSVPFFQEAVRLDANYARAHAALATVYRDALQNDWTFSLDLLSSEVNELVSLHLESALKSPTPLAHALQSRIYASRGLYDKAVLEAEKAVALDSNSAVALAGLANAVVQADRPAEAVSHIQKAMRLDPHHPPAYLITLGAAQFGLEKYEEAAVTFVRAAKQSPDNEIPLIYLAACYGHLGRIIDGGKAIESANHVNVKLGKGGILTLSQNISRIDSTYMSAVDLNRFGGRAAQERLRVGLSVIPELTWYGRMTVRVGPGGVESNSFEVIGATQIDVNAMKSLHERGAIFIDVSYTDTWVEERIPGSVHFKGGLSNYPSHSRFTRQTLITLAQKGDEVVVYCTRDSNCPTGAYESAMIVSWGYDKVYFFTGDAVQAWKDAGYPVETKPVQ